jgi:tetratricopeptide (TPR) repeat protein
MRIVFAILMIWAWAGMAIAADKPVIGPAPSWVKPLPLPKAAAGSKDAAVVVLLQDQQALLERGRQTVYSEFAIGIQTPQGLAAGNLALPWRPDMDVLTIHKVHILRGDKVIDVLASGQTFTIVRREANLDQAMLDGVLTATLQPEGLQVGDVVNTAMSVSSSDPTLKGHSEHIVGGWNGLPVTRAHLRVQWPSELPIRIRQTEGLPSLKPRTEGATTGVEVTLDNMEAFQPPNRAPQRYRMIRMVEFSDFKSWSDLAELMAPLYATAAVLPTQGPLHNEFLKIKALPPDPKARAEAALALVQDRVRYVALAMGDGGLVPADAQTTWSRRFGDCKGKTALLLALLHALDIEAEPVAVSTVFGDGLDQRLPMVGLFNHVLVRARIGGRTYWLDGTRTGDKRLDAITVPAFHWGLPLVARSGALVSMVPPPPAQPIEEVAIHMDATAGLSVPAPTRIEMISRGDAAVTTNLILANIDGAARERSLRDYWKERYDFIDVKSTKVTFDPDRKELRIAMEGEARMDWDGGLYETDNTGVGYKADFSREPGANADAPFAVPYPYFQRTVQTILLPPGFGGSAIDDSAQVNETIAGIEYRRSATLSGTTFRIEKTERSVASEFSARDAPAAQARLRALAEKTVYVRKPRGYQRTERETADILASTPEDAEAFLDRGRLQLDAGRYDAAIADFDRAAALDPKSVWPIANRGIARVWKGDEPGAARDIDAAYAMEPRNPVIFRARGLLALRKGETAAAIAAFTTVLEIEPDNAFALGHRANAYSASGNEERALADAAAAIKLSPGWVGLYLLRANLLRDRGEEKQALAEAAAVTSANPGEPLAHVTAGRIYAAFKRDTEAMRAFERAIAIKPEAYIYVNRSEVRPKDDLAGRRADLDAALRIDPKLPDAVAAKAGLQQDSGDDAGAIQTWSAALAAAPGDFHFLIGRGGALARAGKTAPAETDFAAARAKAAGPGDWNSLCWAKATAGLSLESALEDCNAALRGKPEASSYLDSRGLVLLRLGRLDQAAADYDRALALRPQLAPSLLGRALVRARKGDKAGAAADRAAALKSDPAIEKEFHGYGLKL